jgi:hypothetical protein
LLHETARQRADGTKRTGRVCPFLRYQYRQWRR